MTTTSIAVCQCAHCQQESEHPDQVRHRQMNVFLSRLDEAQRRWYVALESNRLGHGGDVLLARITGIDEKTIRRGREELQGSWSAVRPTASGGWAQAGHRGKKRPDAHRGPASGRGARDGGGPDGPADVGAQ